MKNKIFFATIMLLIGIEILPAKSQALFDIETGIVSTGYSDVRITGNQGTFFSLKDDLKPKTKAFYRLRASYTIKSRHTF